MPLKGLPTINCERPKKDRLLECRVEDVLDKNNIFYNKSEVWIDSEKLYEVIYTFEMEVENYAE